MAKQIRISLAQLNFVVGDLTGNFHKHVQAIQSAIADHVDVIAFPELSITGYPSEDYFLRPSYIQAAEALITQLLPHIGDIYCIVGHPYAENGHVYNGCSILYQHQVIKRYAKQCLPAYGVFDEYRYFLPTTSNCLLKIRDVNVGVLICEDLWLPDPAAALKKAGAEIIISINASPYETDKENKRVALLTNRSITNQVPIAYVNYVTGQDDVVFDGGSMFVDQAGLICQLADCFVEATLTQTILFNPTPLLEKHPVNFQSTEEKIYDSLVFATKEYISKNKFPGVLIGLSGGIDSALTLAIAVDALGADKVKAVMMPSRYTSQMSLDDALAMIRILGVASTTISIEPTYITLLESLAAEFEGCAIDTTEENLQARCRAIILMALSNKTNALVLTTGNRSELAVGYCTLYGDMAGGFAVIKDIPKTLVYRLSDLRNQRSLVIPQRIIDRPPSAELAADQKDVDSLPSYEILDGILQCYINQSMSISDIIVNGYDSDLVNKIITLLHRNEYKRSQGAIGPRINHKSFGRDWRYPLTALYKA